VFFPDDIIGWLPFAVIGAVRLQRARPVDAIFSTSSPVTAHLIAGVVHRVTGLPWVAEFRDPWVGNVLDSSQPRMLRTLRRRTERWIVRNASEVILVTLTLARMYAARYPAANLSLVTNGYDRGETVVAAPKDPAGPFRIVFTGTLDRPAELQTFLEGVQRLVARRPDLATRLAITFFGLVSDECRRVLDRMTTGSLESIVSVEGFVTRSAAGHAVANADAALVLLGAGPGMDLYIGGKLYDYLGHNQQVFAMVPAGDARDLLQGLDWGVVADPDPASVGAGLERLIEEPRPSRLADPDGRYDRATLAARLAAVLERAVEETGNGA